MATEASSTSEQTATGDAEAEDLGIDHSGTGGAEVESEQIEESEGSDKSDSEDDEVGGALSKADLIPDRALENATDDRFQHKALARRVSELALEAEPPLNIALFGAWGSGKSSLAGLIRERLKGGSAAFVYYDAWKFGGTSLRRNFISNAATKLKLGPGKRHWEKYHEGLYESKRRARFHAGSAFRPILALLLAFLFVLILLVAVACGALAIASTFNDENVLGEIERSLPKYLAPSGIAALVVGLITAAIAVGRVDIDRSALSHEEEFTERFRDLITDGLNGPTTHWWNKKQHERIVFFIDELDRCTEKDVVETLVALRTFLDEKHCIFIVAADRDVLETALQEEVKQATPTDVIDPYYTTAGAFLDKIFGHQIEIPPLRGRRLTRFARDLVRGRAGVWGEIVDASGQGGLDSVVYALIPAHVRSPRRIKVLLNNFATNARVAEGRGIAWPARAEEIAKLTALQTEFPSLAEDLELEPRLPRFLLKPDDPEISERAQQLVARHSVDDSARDETEDPTVYLDRANPEAAKQRRREMRKRHRQQLRRYLERTDRVPNPQRDLLFLEAAGAAVGLEDPELGELIEERAPEAPNEVIQAIAQRDEKEQVASARLLADIVQDTIADEQTSVVLAMMEVSSLLGARLSDQAAGDVAKSLRLFSRDKDLAPEHLVGALAIALRVDDQELEEVVTSRPEPWSDPNSLSAIALLLPMLPESRADRLFAEMATVIPQSPALLLPPLRDLAEEDAMTLLEEPRIRAAIKQYLADPAVDLAERQAFADQLVGVGFGE